MRLGFLLLMGLPSSGKTTLAKALSRKLENCSEGIYHFIHICYDELLSFPNGNYEFEWKLARNSLTIKIENLVVAIKNKNIDLSPPEFRSQFDSIPPRELDIALILDDNMYYKSMRYSLFQIARKHNIGFCQVFLNCSLENALLKNNLRKPESVMPPHVIENMYSKIEPPNSKNEWEKYSVELDAFCNLNEMLCKIFPVLNDSFNNFMSAIDNSEMKELSRVQCRKSVLHQTDIALRKIIGCKIKKHFRENPNAELKDYITSLNIRKFDILSDIKTENICLPEEVLDEINSSAIDKFQLMSFLDSYF